MPPPLPDLPEPPPQRLSGPRLKEPFCALSHGAGAVLSVAALVPLGAAAARSGTWRAAGLIIFGASLLLLYTASALYHGLRVPPHWQARLQRLDHGAIFVLIAGTYAPFCLGPLWGPWGSRLLLAEYTLAAIGILLALAQRRGSRAADAARLVLYLTMGWAVVAAAGPLHAALPGPGSAWLIAGGIAYTLGAVVFATDRPHLWPGRFSAHDLWHLFVLAGSACHFVAVQGYLAPLLAASGA